MKTTLVMVSAFVCLGLCAQAAIAGDYTLPADRDAGSAGNEWYTKLKPAFSVGAAVGGDSAFTLNTSPAGSLSGVNHIAVRPAQFVGYYIAGELPLALNDRVTVTAKGRWADSGAGMDEFYAGPGGASGSRSWQDDNSWATAEFLVSYAFLKQSGPAKDVSLVTGFRYDDNEISFRNPAAIDVVSVPTDTMDFKMFTWSPLIGLNTTLDGKRICPVGGDIKLGIFGSPITFTRAEYRETFTQPVLGPIGLFHFSDQMQGMFLDAFAEYTVISCKLSPGVQASGSIFFQYTQFFAHGGVTVKNDVSGFSSGFHFDSSPNLAVVGLKASLAF